MCLSRKKIEMPPSLQIGCENPARPIMTTPYSYVIHIYDEETPLPLRISARHLDEEAQLYTRKQETVPRHKKRCWEITDCP